MTEAVLFSVVQLGEFPTTRSVGRDGRNRLEELLTDQHVDVTVDFTGVDAMTISFVDEFLGKFLTTYDAAAEDATVVVAGLNTENREAVTVCMERRETNVVILDPDGSRTLVGDQILAETFEAIRDLPELKANDAAGLLALSPQNANNRLKRLVAAGALRKSRAAAAGRGGKEFLYHPVQAELLDTTALSSL